MTRIAIVPTGAANIASLCAAIERIGAQPVWANDADAIRSAQRLIMPGVGAFGAVMSRLSFETCQALRQRVFRGAPTLGICLGMQLFARDSEESPGVMGLNVWPDTVRRFPSSVCTPQMGWNRLQPSPDSRWIHPGSAYFANTYYLPRCPSDWQPTWSRYGPLFLAAAEKDQVLLCQFHPELSGPWGLDLLKRWCFNQPKGETVSSPPRNTARIIPCLDVRNGKVVKGIQFQDLRETGDPQTLAATYARQGADELVMLDVSATPEGRATAADTVRKVRAEVALPLTVGGGVRTVEDAQRLLNSGADKVAINSAAVDNPQTLSQLAERFGSQCVVLSLDAARTADGWEVVTHSGTRRTGLDAVAWAREATRRGAGEILLTSVDRDGTLSGYDTELLQAVRKVVSVPIIASGGASTPEHFQQAIAAGARGLLAASIFHDGVTTVASLKESLQQGGNTP